MHLTPPTSQSEIAKLPVQPDNSPIQRGPKSPRALEKMCLFKVDIISNNLREKFNRRYLYIYMNFLVFSLSPFLALMSPFFFLECTQAGMVLCSVCKI